MSIAIVKRKMNIFRPRPHQAFVLGPLVKRLINAHINPIIERMYNGAGKKMSASKINLIFKIASEIIPVTTATQPVIS